jgi:hypothetical protein
MSTSGNGDERGRQSEQQKSQPVSLKRAHSPDSSTESTSPEKKAKNKDLTKSTDLPDESPPARSHQIITQKPTIKFKFAQ